MATSYADNDKIQSCNGNEAIAVEVLSVSGSWVSGYELLQFRDDGLVTVRSIRTGATRSLAQQQWRDPMEKSLLEAYGIQC